MKKAHILATLALLVAFAGALSFGVATTSKVHAAAMPHVASSPKKTPTPTPSGTVYPMTTCTGSYYEIDNLVNDNYHEPNDHITVYVQLDGMFDNTYGTLCRVRAYEKVTSDSGYSYSGGAAGYVCALPSGTTLCSDVAEYSDYLSGSYFLLLGSGTVLGSGSSISGIGPWVSHTDTGNLEAGGEFGMYNSYAHFTTQTPSY